MKHFGTVALAVVALTTVVGGVPARAEAPHAPYIESLTYAGSGCPSGSIGQSISNNRRSATIIFDRFVASSGTGVAASENMKNCAVTLNLRRLADACGSKESLAVDYRGYVQVAAGIAGTHSANYSQGVPVWASLNAYPGPTAADYLVSDAVSLPTIKGGVSPVIIDSEVRLSGQVDTVASQMTTDSMDIVLTTAPTNLVEQLLCTLGLGLLLP